MLRLLISLVPAAIGLALSPIPIITVTLMLASKRAVLNSSIYAATWVLSMLVVGAWALFLVEEEPVLRTQAKSPAAMWGLLALGLLFFLFGAIQWRNRPRSDAEVKLPIWLKAVENLPPYMAFVFGLAGVIFNVKNLAIFVAAITHIAHADLGILQSWIALLVFVALASATIVVPVLLFIVERKRAQPYLDRLRTRMTRYNAAILAWVFFVMGAVTVLDALERLAVSGALHWS